MHFRCIPNISYLYKISVIIHMLFLLSSMRKEPNIFRKLLLYFMVLCMVRDSLFVFVGYQYLFPKRILRKENQLNGFWLLINFKRNWKCWNSLRFKRNICQRWIVELLSISSILFSEKRYLRYKMDIHQCLLNQTFYSNDERIFRWYYSDKERLHQLFI